MGAAAGAIEGASVTPPGPDPRVSGGAEATARGGARGGGAGGGGDVGRPPRPQRFHRRVRRPVAVRGVGRGLLCPPPPPPPPASLGPRLPRLPPPRADPPVPRSR